MPKPVLPLPALTPAVATVLDEAYQRAFGRLVARRIAAARGRLVAEHGDLYSQERVGRLLGQSQTWVSNIENAQRRVDSGALLILSTLYNVPITDFVRPPTGDEEDVMMRRWIRAHRALLRESTDDEGRKREQSAEARSRPRARR